MTLIARFLAKHRSALDELERRSEAALAANRRAVVRFNKALEIREIINERVARQRIEAKRHAHGMRQFKGNIF